ncbi:MAG: FHA domain-containing protein [Gemmataceae bacterium]|nr:FHA domain-containing protein [Gemmataceae bacterium]
MSLMRLIIWSSLIGGWSAFVSWFLAEVLFHYWIDEDSKVAITLSIVMATIVAIAIGGGVSLASGLTNPKMPNLVKRLLIGFGGGLIGGIFASLLGACVFALFEKVMFLGFLSRVFGWTLTGLAVGVTEGLFDRDINKIRNGLIGGGLGGLLAGLLFEPVRFVIGSPMSSRAFAFVLLGLFIGFFIGLAQVVLKEAWLTVEAGFRPGRQMILGNDLITMGTSEKASLIFIAYGAKGVEPVHLKITKQPDGRFVLEDNQSRGGTLLNGQPISGPTVLLNGDAIQLGVNVVKFNERAKHGDAKLPAPVIQQAPAPVIPLEGITAKTPSSSAVQAAPKPAPKPAPAPQAPAAPAKAEEGRCPICDKKVVGIPGQRRCGKCFTSF